MSEDRHGPWWPEPKPPGLGYAEYPDPPDTRRATPGQRMVPRGLDDDARWRLRRMEQLDETVDAKELRRDLARMRERAETAEGERDELRRGLDSLREVLGGNASVTFGDCVYEVAGYMRREERAARERSTLLSMLHRACRELDVAGSTKPAAAIREELEAMGVSDGG